MVQRNCAFFDVRALVRPPKAAVATVVEPSCPDMYSAHKEWMTSTYPEKKQATQRQYRDVFNTEFNISFFLPKKDVCDECTTWLHTPEVGKAALEDTYNKHLENKKIVHEMVKYDKTLARHKDNKTLCVAHFDYEKNLICPKADTSVFYCRRKLCVINFTLVDVGKYLDNCYVYDETIGRKGSNEVSSFLLHFIERKVETGIKEFRFYSDNCGGQNKNKNVTTLYAYAAAKYNVRIVHTFLEKNHSNLLSQTMWIDLSEKLQLIKDTDKEPVPWRSIRQISAEGTSPHELQFKIDHKEEPRTISTKKVRKPVNFCTFTL
ncbi:hypothetical protein FOCC_FOCC015530 [Frankliniella occidentalis]|nr:hypothetical protein FOCC_FOCC015530 [Frankliniella occidentalis]